MIMDITARSVEEVLKHHLDAVRGCDLEGTLLDYCEESVIMAMDGPVKGLDEIREFFAGSFKTTLPPESVWTDTICHMGDEVVLCVWNAKSPFVDIPFGTDTFVIRGGKIVQQSFAGIINPL